MVDNKIRKAFSWREEYDKLKDILSQTKAEIILKQLQKAEKDTPELYAAFAMLALLLPNEISHINAQHESNPRTDCKTILNAIPPIVVNVAMKQKIVLPLRAILCSELNKWALSKFLKEIENPNPTQPYPEPAHYCGD